MGLTSIITDNARYSSTPTRTLAPTAAPIEISDLKSVLQNQGGDATNEEMLQFIGVATDKLEEYLSIALLLQTWRIKYDAFPNTERYNAKGITIELPYSPAIAILSVKTYDAEDSPTTMSSSDYVLDNDNFPSLLHFNDTASIGRSFRGLEVIYTAGYGQTRDLIPAPLKLALALWAKHLMIMNRNGLLTPADTKATITNVPAAVRDVLSLFNPRRLP